MAVLPLGWGQAPRAPNRATGYTASAGVSVRLMMISLFNKATLTLRHTLLVVDVISLIRPVWRQEEHFRLCGLIA